MGEDLIVKRLITPKGHTLYIVIELNGSGNAVADALAGAISAHGGHGQEALWLLREQDARAVVDRAQKA